MACILLFEWVAVQYVFDDDEDLDHASAEAKDGRPPPALPGYRTFLQIWRGLQAAIEDGVIECESSPSEEMVGAALQHMLARQQAGEDLGVLRQTTGGVFVWRILPPDKATAPSRRQHGGFALGVEQLGHALLRPYMGEWTGSFGSATIAIREHMNHSRSKLLQGSGEDDDRVHKSASGTAKYTLHQRCMANALGFGPDDTAPKHAPLGPPNRRD